MNSFFVKLRWWTQRSDKEAELREELQFHLEQVFRGALNVLGDRLAVGGSGKQGAEDEQVERALQEPDTGRGITTHCVDILRYFM